MPYSLKEMEDAARSPNLSDEERGFLQQEIEKARTAASHTPESARAGRSEQARRADQQFAKEESIDKAELEMHRADTARESAGKRTTPVISGVSMGGMPAYTPPEYSQPRKRLERAASLAGPTSPEAGQLIGRNADRAASGALLGTLLGLPFGPYAGGAVAGGGSAALEAIGEEAPPIDVAKRAGTGAGVGLVLAGLLGIPSAAVKGLRNHMQYGDDVALVERGGGRPAAFSSGGIKDPPVMKSLTLGPKAPRQIAERHAPKIVERVITKGDEAAKAGEAADTAFYASEAGRRTTPTGNVIKSIDDAIAANRATPTGAPKSMDLDSKLEQIRSTIASAGGGPTALGPKQVQDLLRDQIDELARYGKAEGGKLAEDAAQTISRELRGVRAKEWPEFEPIKAAQEAEIGAQKGMQDAFNVPSRNLSLKQVLGDRKIMEGVEARLEQLGTKTLDFSDPHVQEFIKRNPDMEQLLNEIASVGATTRLQTGGAGVGLSTTMGADATPRLYNLIKGARLRADPVFKGLDVAMPESARVAASGAGGQSASRRGKVSPNERRSVLDWIYGPGGVP